jgi:hypothetical protein
LPGHRPRGGLFVFFAALLRGFACDERIFIPSTVNGHPVNLLLDSGAGISLTGLAATTHTGAMDELRALGTDFEVRPDARVVHNGRVITSTGISAGIDMALHVVGRLLGQAVAEETATYMQYDWTFRHVDRPNVWLD